MGKRNDIFFGFRCRKRGNGELAGNASRLSSGTELSPRNATWWSEGGGEAGDGDVMRRRRNEEGEGQGRGRGEEVM